MAAASGIKLQLRFATREQTRNLSASLNEQYTANLFRIPISKVSNSKPHQCGMEPGSGEFQINTAIQSTSWFGANLLNPPGRRLPAKSATAIVGNFRAYGNLPPYKSLSIGTYSQGSHRQTLAVLATPHFCWSSKSRKYASLGCKSWYSKPPYGQKCPPKSPTFHQVAALNSGLL